MIRTLLVCMLLLPFTSNAQFEVGVHGMDIPSYYNFTLKMLYNFPGVQLGAWGELSGKPFGNTPRGEEYLNQSGAGIFVNLRKRNDPHRFVVYPSMGIGWVDAWMRGMGFTGFFKAGGAFRVTNRFFICPEFGVQLAFTKHGNENNNYSVLCPTIGFNYRFGKVAAKSSEAAKKE